VTASRIVVDRDQNGPYATLDDLERVAGIGPKTVARLREDAVAGP
jgi:competence protein ComEA